MRNRVRGLFWSVARGMLLAATAATALALPEAVAQQPFPNRPLRFVHPFPGGSATDTIYRPVMDLLSTLLGQPIITDPRPGGSSTVASIYVRHQPPDGYTFYLASSSLIVRSLVPNAEIDVRKDFTPIACNTVSPLFLVVNSEQVKATTLKELIDDARAHPGQINYASYGVGSGAHIFLESLLYDAKVNMVHIPYQGTAQATADTAAGRTQVTATIIATMRPFVSSYGGNGKLRVLAASTAERSPLAPDVPGMKDSGFPHVDSPQWGGYVGPAGVPRSAVDVLNRAMTAAYKDPKIIELTARFGQVPFSCTPDELARMISKEYDNLAALVREAGIKLQ